jgi:hypothetical protein
VSEYHDAIIGLSKYLGQSTPLNANGEALKVEPLEIYDSSGSVIASEAGTDNALPDLVSDYSHIDAVREALYGKSPGTPDMPEIISMLSKAEPSIDGSATICIQPWSGDIATGEAFPGGFILTNSTGGTDMYPIMTKGSLPTNMPRETGTPVYNIATMDCSFSRETGSKQAMSIFLNMIPTTELSRAVPYIDVQFMGSVKQADGSQPTGRSMGVPSLYRFLVGEGLEAGEYAGWAQTSSGLELMDGSDDSSEASERTKLKQSSGMEVFLSPQTLVNADERAGTSRIGGFKSTKTQGVLDPFRPFMSLTSLSINIAPVVNSIVFSEGTLTFTLHDKSRIGEISSLTNPRNMGDTYVRIEYGWSHPDGYGTLSGDPAAGLFGKLLNNFRTTETFVIANSNYTFTANGEVQITCSIMASGAAAASSDARILDDKVASELALINRVENAIISIRDALPEPGAGTPPIIRPRTIFENAGKGAGVFGIDMEDQENAINTFLNSVRAAGDSIEADVGAAWEEAFGADGDALANFEAAKQSISGALTAKIVQLKSAPDPWLCSDAVSKDDTPPEAWIKTGSSQLSDSDINSATYSAFSAGTKEYASLAKIVSTFIVEPIVSNSSADKSHFEECQVFYGTINSRASHASGLSLACVPIKISAFQAGLEEIMENTGPNITVGTFISFINNYFFDNEAFYLYGFGSSGRLYTRTINNDTGLYDYKVIESETTQTSAHNHRQTVLQEAYGSGAHLEFKQPLIKYFIEAPDNSVIEPEISESGRQVNRSKKILRIYIEDEKSMSYSGAADLMSRVFTDHIPSAIPENRGTGANDEAATSNAWERWDMSNMYTMAEELGLLEEAGGTVQFTGGSAWKQLMRQSAPTIDLGSMHTGIMNASIQSQNGGDGLRDVHMLAGTDGDANSPGHEFMPLTMMPQSLTLDMMGCPLIAPLQSYFVDFHTGTDLDALYSVNSVTHELAGGKFTTSANLLYTGGYAAFQPASRRLGNLAAYLDSRGVPVDVSGPEAVDGAIEDGAEEAATFNSEMQRIVLDARINNAFSGIESAITEAERDEAAAAHAEAVAAADSFYTSTKVNILLREMNQAYSMYTRYKTQTESDRHADLTIEMYTTQMDTQEGIFKNKAGHLQSWVDNYASGPEDDQTQKTIIEARLAHFKTLGMSF